MNIGINSSIQQISTGFGVNGKETKSIFGRLASSIRNIKNSITNLFKTQETKSVDIYNVDLKTIENEKKDNNERLKEREDLKKLHVNNRMRNNNIHRVIEDSTKIIDKKSNENNNNNIKEDNSYFLKAKTIYNIEELIQLNSNMETTESNVNTMTFASFKKIASINNLD